MSYTYITRAQFRTQLARNLQDASNLGWPAAELNLYIDEALRTWSMLTNYWRDRGSFNTSPLVVFYDLIAKLPLLLGNTLTVQDYTTLLEYHLFEPATPTVWTGSSMFTLTDLVNALQNRRNQFLVDTGAVATRITPAGPPTPVGRLTLDDDTIDILRVVWIDALGVYHVLSRTNEFQLNAYSPGWTGTPAMPSQFSTLSVPQLTLQLAPPPDDVGSLEIIITQAPIALVPADDTLLNIPDDMAWIPKWGALADLLSRDGNARDDLRAQYCKMRYDHGIKSAALSSSVVQVEINGVATMLSSIQGMDNYKPGWQNITPTAPMTPLLIGQNLLGLSPTPDSIYSITLDVVRNAITPTADGDYIQVGHQDIAAILGYCQHLAEFKKGGAEFAATFPLLRAFVRQAEGYNSRLSALDDFMLTSMQTLESTATTPIALTGEGG